MSALTCDECGKPHPEFVEACDCALRARIVELEARVAGAMAFFQAYEINDLDDFAREMSDPILMAGLGAECAKRTKAHIARAKELETKTDLQQGFFNAAMDRAEKAEARVAELERGWDTVLLALGTIRKNAKSQIDGMNSMGVPDDAPERKAAIWYYTEANDALR